MDNKIVADREVQRLLYGEHHDVACFGDGSSGIAETDLRLAMYEMAVRIALQGAGPGGGAAAAMNGGGGVDGLGLAEGAGGEGVSDVGSAAAMHREKTAGERRRGKSEGRSRRFWSRD